MGSLTHEQWTITTGRVDCHQIELRYVCAYFPLLAVGTFPFCIVEPHRKSTKKKKSNEINQTEIEPNKHELCTRACANTCFYIQLKQSQFQCNEGEEKKIQFFFLVSFLCSEIVIFVWCITRNQLHKIANHQVWLLDAVQRIHLYSTHLLLTRLNYMEVSIIWQCLRNILWISIK